MDDVEIAKQFHEDMTRQMHEAEGENLRILGRIMEQEEANLWEAKQALALEQRKLESAQLRVTQIEQALRALEAAMNRRTFGVTIPGRAGCTGA